MPQHWQHPPLSPACWTDPRGPAKHRPACAASSWQCCCRPAAMARTRWRLPAFAAAEVTSRATWAAASCQEWPLLPALLPLLLLLRVAGVVSGRWLCLQCR